MMPTVALGSIRDGLTRLGIEVRLRIGAVARTLRETPRERWFWMGLAALLLMFLLLLVTQPTGAGRGGR